MFLIEEFLENAKAGKVHPNGYEDDETKKHEEGHIPDKTGKSYFQFFQGAKSGSFEFFSQGAISLDYGLCIHGAYLSFGYAD